MNALADTINRAQKDRLISLYRNTSWWLKWPRRMWLRGMIENRIPPIKGRTWRTSLSPATHVSLLNGTIKYTYRGVRMITHPIDLALYMKLLYELKPRSVIELGSRDGGTAAWFGDMMVTYGQTGVVVSIDLAPPNRPYFAKPNVRFVQGDEGNLSPLKDIFHNLPHPWMLINDASHNANTMLRGMRYLHQFFEKGDYLIIEDSCLTEAGLDWNGNRQGGPALAIAQFLNEYSGCYEIDTKLCDFYGRNVTANANGYLKRIK